MSMRANPKITAVDIHATVLELHSLIARCSSGEEIVITQAGTPVAMLASLESIRVLSSVGAINFELPIDQGGFGWIGPDDNAEARREAEQAYAEQFQL